MDQIDDASRFQPTHCATKLRTNEILGSLRHDDEDYEDECRYHWDFDKTAFFSAHLYLQELSHAPLSLFHGLWRTCPGPDHADDSGRVTSRTCGPLASPTMVFTADSAWLLLITVLPCQ